MTGVLNVGEMGALALHTMSELALLRTENAETRISVPQLAKRLVASTHTLHKVVTNLVAAGLIESVRGPNGGVRLLREANDISLLTIIEAVNRKVTGNRCLFTKPACPEGAPCPFTFLTRDLEEILGRYFSETTLEKLLSGRTMSFSESHWALPG